MVNSQRLKNRNPGYSDFSNIGPTPSFNFSTNNSSPMSHGANALKLENEVTSDSFTQSVANEEINHVNNQYHEELLKNQQVEKVVENTSNEDEISFTEEVINKNEDLLKLKENSNNDLSEFGVDSDAPDLFNSDNDSSNSNDLFSSENDEQEDDLEIPAFLRRQKN